MELVEVDLGLGNSLLPPIIQVIMIDHVVFIIMAIKRLDIGTTLDSFMHMNMEE